MIAVLTGDIVNSRQEPSKTWMPLLKDVLGQYGRSPNDWEIFRGDSFQLCLQGEQGLRAALHIKSGMKELKGLDARIGIGIGDEDYKAERVSESNGTAYTYSGRSFEALKKDTLKFASGIPRLDELFNLLFSLAGLTIDDWTPIMAGAVRTCLEHPGKNQTQLAELIGKSQSTLSEALTRAGYEEVLKLERFYRKEVQEL